MVKARGFVILVLAALGAALLVALAIAKPGDQVRTYGTSGVARLPADTRVLDSAVQRDGKLVVVGVSGEDAGRVRMLVARFTAAGKRDPKFRGGKTYTGAVGTIGHAVAIQGDGKIVVAGETTDPAATLPSGMLVLRLKSNGSPDRTFSGNGIADALTDQIGLGLGVAIQGDRKIVVSGSARPAGANSDGYPRAALARFKPGGGLDRAFGQRGTVVLDQAPRFSVANDVEIQGNRRIVYAGSHRGNLQSTEVMVGRLQAGGAVDRSFSGDGFFFQQFAEGAAFSAAYGVELASGGKIVIGGTATSDSEGAVAFAARFSGGGALDRGFSGDGIARVPASANPDTFGRDPLPGARAVLLSGNEVILAGHFDELGIRQAAVWALRGNGSPDPRFAQGGRKLFASFPGQQQGAQSQFDAVAAARDGSLLPGGNLGEFLEPPAGMAVKLRGF